MQATAAQKQQTHNLLVVTRPRLKTHVSSSWQPILMQIIDLGVTRLVSRLDVYIDHRRDILIKWWDYVGSVFMQWWVPNLHFVCVWYVLLFLGCSVLQFTNELSSSVFRYQSLCNFPSKAHIFSRSFSNLFQSLASNYLTDWAIHSILCDGI